MAATILMVMPLIDGVTLTTLHRNVTGAGRRIPLPIASAIVVGLLRGLHAAHTATGPDGAPLEIIHRDVSPQNVLVGVDGVTRVLDFGVAKANGQLHATRAGEVRGKPAYMAPEHLRSGATVRSDLYSAAVVLWEAITCDRLFVSESEAGLLTKVLEGRVRSPREVAPEIPPALDALVMRSLSYDPFGRPPSAERMAQELAAVVPPSPVSEVGRFVSRFGGEQLERLARAMRAVDRGLTPPEVVAPTTPPSPRMPQRALPELPVGAAVRRGVGEVTQTGPTAGPALLPPARRRLGWLPVLSAMIVLGVVAGASLAWRVSTGSTPNRPTSGSVQELEEARIAPGVSAATEPVVLPSSRESAAPAEATSEPAASASEQPSRSTSSSSTAQAPRTPQPPMPTKTTAPSSGPTEPEPPKSNDCDPPYELDQNGVRRIKTRCFKVVP